jgi:hypothetical protein
MEVQNGKFGYLGNVNVKKDGVSQEWSLHEVEEYSKCVEDAAYFARNYIKIVHLDLGLTSFDLYPYQEKMFQHFER